MPGNAGDFPAEESFYTFIERAVCFFTEETNDKSSSSPFGIKLCDRISGRPLHLDISDEPMKKGIITNRNKFVLGGSALRSVLPNLLKHNQVFPMLLMHTVHIP